ncbi:serpin family protein [Nesterenkonia natronophila]|uniref:Serpin family protein n=1 Tax=Nesterenkonia natronophila TaxID=2174932 RepID=A0A3A4FAB8_9MICC|nr:serpin family protein [Nesterenkonia natronophila]RJN32097.1 serpin family protein [Nesterenkonia natronophila]
MRHDHLFRTAGALLLGLLTLSACMADHGQEVGSAEEYEPASLSEADALADVVSAATRFGAEALVESAQGQNVVLSPASIMVALAMLGEGAEGPAAAELDELLGAAGADRTSAFSALQAAVLEYDGDPAVVQEDDLPDTPLLHMANQLVLSDSPSPDQDFLDVLASSYDAGVVTADFAAADSQQLLDEWVYEHTGGLVKESAVETPDPDLVFVLLSAIVLAAQWQVQFDPANTAQRDFTTAGGDTVEAETMQQTFEAAYTEHDDAQVIRLPYTEGFAMDVVLPADVAAPADFTDQSWSAVDAAFAEETQTSVDLALPTVDMQNNKDLVTLLKGMGAPNTVAGNDLSRIDPAVEINQAAHQAVLRIDEEGTVAAAVTEIAGVTSAPVDPPDAVEMTVDRPYLVRIVHQETNWPLFMASIADPTEG